VLLRQYTYEVLWRLRQRNFKTDGGGDGKTPGSGTTAPDDGKLGGIGLGMEVWDDCERELKVWEAAEAVQEANASSSLVTLSHPGFRRFKSSEAPKTPYFDL